MRSFAPVENPFLPSERSRERRELQEKQKEEFDDRQSQLEVEEILRQRIEETNQKIQDYLQSA
jgi:hypothetical protein